MRGALACLALLLATPGLAQEVTIPGELTRADYETYREVPFTVPTDVDRVTVRLTYDKADKSVVDLGIWDTNRFRGWSGGTRDRITLSATDASPGYLPGPLPGGAWKVVLGVPNIRVGATSRYRVDIWFDRGAHRAASAAIADPPLRDGPAWYRGDLHMHDANSDGSCTPRSNPTLARIPCPLSRTVEAAAAAGLDFIAVTDHNTVSHFDGLREQQPWVAPMLLIPGIEITTFHGHANIFAPNRFVDFRLASRSGIRALQDDVAAAGAILSINHPALPSGEVCMGCGWTWTDTDWSHVSAIEAVNGVHADGPLSGLAFWYARLDAGDRITGIAGSDNHNPDGPVGQSRIGRPSTVVHATNLSTAAVLRGIREGNVFIDVEGSRNRLLEVHATQAGTSVPMGGTLRSRGAFHVEVHVLGAKGALMKLVGTNTEVLATRPILQDEERFTLPLRNKPGLRWFAVQISRASHSILLSNPIYLR